MGSDSTITASGDDVSLAASEDPQLVYDGRTGELFRLWFKALLLSVVTLGFYRFWGRTRLRKYLWSRVSLAGDRLEYDGTGGELFRRFLVALVVLLPLLFLPNLLLLLGVKLVIVEIVNAARVVLLLFLIQLGRYGGRRYRISRTLWRGIRGGLDGSSAGYALRSLKYLILAPLTLGVSVPWQIVGLWRYEMSNTGLGDRQFRFEGSGRDLRRAYLIAYARAIGVVLGAILLAVGIALGMIGLSTLKAFVAHHRGVGLHAVAAYSGLVFLILMPIFLMAEVAVAVSFEIKAIAYLARSTRLDAVGFAAVPPFWQLLRLNIGNLLLAVVTLGTGSAFLAHRKLRFYCRHLRLIGSASLETLTQEPGRRRPSGGEGLLQLLDTSGFA